MSGYSDEQIEALIAAATPEPWCYYGGDLWCNVTADELARADRLAEEHDYSDEAEGIFKRSARVFCGDPERREDAEFIAAARELVPSLLARAQQAEKQRDAALRCHVRAVERVRRSEYRSDAAAAHAAAERDKEADRLRAELAEAKAENDELHQLIWKQGQLLTGAVNALRGEPPALTWWSHHDVAERAAEVAAERNRLAAQVAAVRSLFDGGPDMSCRTVWQNGIECVTVPLSDLRAALDGTERDESAGDA